MSYHGSVKFNAPISKESPSFLGDCELLGKFIPNCAQVLQPLTDLLKGSPKHFRMTSEAESASTEVKQLLSRATTLNHLDTSS
ncbi:unnamed protein product [Rodentolepis nana]|uniref:Uncharacterized protein n=1 Tax=Rodentolepis nana TaxID=102285 RepID=A0A0R3T5F9_RODNA|nr:unnamed protein product [Rodentolepis nana]